VVTPAYIIHFSFIVGFGYFYNSLMTCQTTSEEHSIFTTSNTFLCTSENFDAILSCQSKDIWVQFFLSNTV